MFEEKAHKVIDTDVLVVGGGLGGCMAAIKASEKNAKVTLIEKAALRRAGGAVLGLGRTLLVHPDYNVSPEEFAKASVEAGAGIVNEDIPYTVAKESVDRIKDLESWGLKFRQPDGKYLFKNAGDIVSIPNIVVRVPMGADLQPMLAKQVKSRKIDVLERTTLTSILVAGGKVVGATAMNVRDGSFTVFRAKSICVCSGGCYEIYRWKNTAYAPDRGMRVMGTKFGEGASAAYNVGATVVSMELTEGPDISLKDFYAHAWHLTQWTAQPFIDALGNNIATNPFSFQVLKATEVEGRGPFYYDVRNVSPEIKAKTETIARLIPEDFANNLYCTARPLDVWKEPVEFEIRREAHLHGGQAGISINVNAETDIEGLYAAGDTTGGGHKYSSMGAWVFGARAGANAADYARTAPEPDIDPARIEAEKSRVFAPLKQKEGYQWFELQDKVRQIITDYAFLFRSEGKLQRGLERLRHIRDKYLPQMVASSPRDIMRGLEVQSLFTMGELHMEGALHRKESRFMQTGFHYRIDYPETDDKNWLVQIVIRNAAGKPQVSTRKPVRL